jgi:signal transduction histidine kinase
MRLEPRHGEGEATDDADAARLDTILRTCNDAIVFVDDHGTITGWSDSAEDMFGLPRRRAMGGSLDSLFVGKRLLRPLRVALRADGSRLLVEVRSTNARGRESVVIVRDVTGPTLIRSAAAAVASESDASEALASFMDVLVQILPIDNMTLITLEGNEWRRVATAGRAARTLPVGVVVPLAGTPLDNHAAYDEPITSIDTSRGGFPYDRVLAAAGVGSYVALPIKHGGRLVASLNVGFTAVDGPTAGVVELLSSLSLAIMPLVLSLAALAGQAVAIERLERLDALKNDVLALMAHDIRTPLAIIGGFAEHLQDRWDELPEGEKLESIGTISRHALKLCGLADAGLQVTRIESDSFPYELRSVRLEQDVARTVADLPAADAARIRVNVREPVPPVRCDPERHWQILMNLLSNALKFSPSETPIDVDVSHQDRMVEVAVRDRGPGIAATDLPRLFQKFSRIGGPELEATRGTGVGLYISKALVEGQAGQIRVESAPGRGSTFAYALPVAGPEDG